MVSYSLGQWIGGDDDDHDDDHESFQKNSIRMPRLCRSLSRRLTRDGRTELDKCLRFALLVCAIFTSDCFSNVDIVLDDLQEHYH